MDNLILDLKPSEFAGVVCGITGILFAWVSYRRAGRSERLANESNARSIKNETQAREIAFARRRSEVLDLITAGKIAYMGVLRKVVAFQDAAKELGADAIGPTATESMAWANEGIAGLTRMETEVGSYDASGKTHEELMTLMGSQLDTLKRMSNPNLIAEDFAKSSDQVERSLRAIAMHKEVAIQLGQAR